jgi:oxygen-dependent protoporphyrinogen oxidase
MSGLAAAHRLVTSSQPPRVVLIEGGPRLGGSLRSAEVGGVALDTGPESLLARVPWGVELLEELGLLAAAIPAADLGAHLWVRGALRPLPPGLMTATADPKAVRRSGLLTWRGQLRAGLDLVLPGKPLVGDESIADAIGSRFGGEAVGAIAQPLLGGIYAGNADRLSVRAAAPAIAAARQRGGSLLRAIRTGASAAAPNEPVFLSLPGGLASRVTAAIGAELDRAGAEVRLSTVARTIKATADGIEIALTSGEPLRADAVVMAVPAHAAATLVDEAVSAAASALREIRHASIAVATLAFDRSALVPLPRSSGFLAAAGEGLTISACTFSSQKWPQLAPDGPVLIRCSVGRVDMPPPKDDAALMAAIRRDLKTTLGIDAEPLDALVERFDGALPQHEVGHLDRVAAIEAQIASALPRVALAGAWTRGIGLAACARDGRNAARQAMMSLQSN